MGYVSLPEGKRISNLKRLAIKFSGVRRDCFVWRGKKIGVFLNNRGEKKCTRCGQQHSEVLIYNESDESKLMKQVFQVVAYRCPTRFISSFASSGRASFDEFSDIDMRSCGIHDEFMPVDDTSILGLGSSITTRSLVRVQWECTNDIKLMT